NQIKWSSRRARQQEGRVAAMLQESLGGIQLVQAYTREDYEFERFRREAAGSLQASIRATMLQARFSPVVDFLAAAGSAVVLWGVSFTYPTRSEPALRDVSLSVEPGQIVALVGRTGAGKSTIASLVPRFYDVAAGEVTVDGIDVRKWDLRTLRESVSLVL